MCILLNVKKHEKTFALNVDIFNTKNRKDAHLTTKKIHSKIRCKQILYEFRLGSRQT